MPDTEQITWDVAAWRRDTQLMSALGRGVYREICDWLNIHLHYGGVFTGSRDELARAGRCTAVELETCLHELSRKPAVANVSECNGHVTLICRRLRREAKARENGRSRVLRHRGHEPCNGHVTPHVTPLIANSSQKLDRSLSSLSGTDKDDQAIKTDKAIEALEKGGPGGKTKSLPAGLSALALRVEKCLGPQWVNDAGKWVNRVKSDPCKVDRVIAEVELAIRESRIRTTPAQYAHQTWEEFSPSRTCKQT